MAGGVQKKPSANKKAPSRKTTKRNNKKAHKTTSADPKKRASGKSGWPESNKRRKVAEENKINQKVAEALAKLAAQECAPKTPPTASQKKTSSPASTVQYSPCRGLGHFFCLVHEWGLLACSSQCVKTSDDTCNCKAGFRV